MRICITVTGCAVHGRAFEDTIDMAVLASHSRMLTVKVEGEQGVVNRCKFPAFGRVTGRAIVSELTVVMVILYMAGDTFLGGRF